VRFRLASARPARALAAGAAAVACAAAAVGCDHGSGRSAPAGSSANACASLVAGHPLAPPPVNPDVPVLGYNPYNTFGTSIGQNLIVSIVHAMNRNGMRAAGYRYVLLDDGWQGARTPSGQLTADPARFPCGIKALAAFVHASGFRFGIYTTPGAKACSGRTGGGGHVTADARTFAQWGVDYVKLDWCGADYSPAGAAAIARTWRSALSVTGRPMILSINAGGNPSVGQWAHLIANSWRVGGDICGSWYNLTRPPAAEARRCYNQQYDEGIYDYLTSPGLRAQAALTSPGHFIDPDMLEVGTAAGSSDPGSPGTGSSDPGSPGTGTALTGAEAGTNFAMWAMWSAPLIAGNDPRTMTGTDQASTVLLNRQLIAVDQDPLGRAATLEPSPAGWQFWLKQLTGGRVALAIVNLADTPATARFTWPQLGLGARPADLLDAVANRAVEAGPQGLDAPVAAHGTAIYELTPSGAPGLGG
jgi:alpha-galactosidase